MTNDHINLDTTSDRLLTEVERQQKYLDRLPDDHTFLDDHRIVHVPTERALHGLQIGAVAVRADLDPVGEATANIVHQFNRRLA